jgi:hypothetical protein
MKFECANCGQRLEVGEDMIGTVAPCPTCGESITVEHASLSEVAIQEPAIKQAPWWKEAICWIAVFPVAAVGHVIASLFGQLAMWLSSSVSGDDTWLFLLVKTLFVFGFSSAAFIYAGCAMAPRYKTVVAWALLVITIAISILGIVLSVNRQDWINLWGYVCSIGGSVMALIAVKESPPPASALLFWRK